MLKLDPKNTELLSQKQEVLNKNIETTEEKLKQLKEIKAKADEKMANGTEINEENYRKLQREIIETQNRLSNLKNEASNWKKAGETLIKWGQNLDKIGSKIDNLGSKLTTRLSIPIVSTFTLATKEAIEFESAFTGVTKTVDGTEEQLNSLKQGIKKLAKEIPSTTTEISAVAEAAGQLGIATDDVLEFTKVMIDLGNSTNVSADEAASSLAKFANITKMSAKDYSKLGSTIVALGNNYATTEADIISMAQNLASAGTQVGMSQSDIMALATSLSSVGLEAQAGGTAFSKALISMQLAVETNSKDLKKWANVAGMSTKEFSKLFKEDATSALQAFIKGLSECGGETESAIKVLNDMGITETRMRDALLRSANASETFSSAIKLGSKSWEENIALTEEANKRYGTTESQLKMAKNKVKDVAISLGDKLLPAINKILDKTEKWIKKLDNLSDSEKENIVKIGLMVAAAGPLLKVFGTITSTTGKVVSGIGTFTKAIGLAKNGIGDATGSAATLAKVFQSLPNPISMAAIGIATATGIIIAEIAKSEKETKKAFEGIAKGFGDYEKGIENAEGYLDKFNDTLFATTEEQQELQKQMDEIQSGITQICKTASDERRDYTQQEITQLDQYFTKLRELEQRELEIEQHKAEAIVQSAKTESEAFNGSLEEYKERSQQWIKTAQQQADKQKEIAENNRINTIALLNNQYSEQERIDNEEYQRKVAQAEMDYQLAIESANKQIGDISEIYTKGYADRADQDEDFAEHVKHYNWEQEQENQRHTDSMKQIEEYYNGDRAAMVRNQEIENERHANLTNKIWNDMYKNMSESERNQVRGMA